MSVTGVGAAKIYPLASGPGTVKVIIASADKKAASSTLVNEVQEYIDSVRPVGATVTVISATELPVNITARVSIGQGENSASVQSKFQLAIIRYLAANAYETGSINLSMIGKILLDTEGVTDYSNLKLNGTAENVNLTEEQIAVIGTVTLEVVT
ncbi:MAG: baseplate J/gp47 family protein, partial [Firmicutes bacterium]|nr:baseplate J/gp47 family protein [Bacillota bacterium]